MKEKKAVIDRFCAALFSALKALLSRVIMNAIVLQTTFMK